MMGKKFSIYHKTFQLTNDNGTLQERLLHQFFLKELKITFIAFTATYGKKDFNEVLNSFLGIIKTVFKECTIDVKLKTSFFKHLNEESLVSGSNLILNFEKLSKVDTKNFESLEKLTKYGEFKVEESRCFEHKLLIGVLLKNYLSKVRKEKAFSEELQKKVFEFFLSSFEVRQNFRNLALEYLSKFQMLFSKNNLYVENELRNEYARFGLYISELIENKYSEVMFLMERVIAFGQSGQNSQAMKALNRAEKIALKSNFKLELGRIYTKKGNLLRKEDVKNSNNYFIKARKILDEKILNHLHVNKYVKYYGEFLFCFWNYLYQNKEIDKSAEVVSLAEKFSIKHSYLEFMFYRILTTKCIYESDWTKSLTYVKNAQKSLDKSEIKFPGFYMSVVKSLIKCNKLTEAQNILMERKDDYNRTNLNMIDLLYADIYMKKNMYQKAINYFSNVLSYYSNENNNQKQILINVRIGMLYEELDKYRSSLKSYKEALKICNLIKDNKKELIQEKISNVLQKI